MEKMVCMDGPSSVPISFANSYRSFEPEILFQFKFSQRYCTKNNRCCMQLADFASKLLKMETENLMV